MAFGREVMFDLDNFQQPKMLTEGESIAQSILNLFMMRPGNMPGMPNIGIYIEQYLDRLQGSFDPEAIKKQLYEQCSELFNNISLGDVKIFIAPFRGQDVLIISVPVTVDNTSQTIMYGFKKNSQNTLSISVQFQNSLVNI